MADPGAIVWDEVVAFWLVLWLVTPAGFWRRPSRSRCSASSSRQARAGGLGRPLFKVRRGEPIGWAQGFGILFDDLVAALCTLLVIALWRLV